MADLDELEALAKRLREEAQVLSWRSLEYGSADAGISSNLADEAATAIDALIARVRAAEGAVARMREQAVLTCEAEAALRKANGDAADAGDTRWGPDTKAASMVQYHKSVTAAFLADAIRALPTPPEPLT